MSEYRGEGVAQSTPLYIPAADPSNAHLKSRIPPARSNGHSPTQPISQPGRLQQPSNPDAHASAALLASTIRFADEVAARPNHGETTLPREDLKRMADLGLLLAPLPAAHGGLGLGVEPGTVGNPHLILLRLFAAIGGADLVLGRIYEGHVNALILIAAYGTPQQLARAAQDCRAGRWFGVWNTGAREAMRLEVSSGDSDSYILTGGKTFASGAAFVQRPVVTVQRPDGSWQMTVPRMESPEVARAVTFDRSFWNPLGMEGSESYGIDFTGATISRDDLIGAPGDFFRDPLFFGGAVRFAAVHAGAILRLHRMFAEWLERGGRGGDPYQVARLGEIAIGAQESVLWVERAAAVAAECLFNGADKLAIERMHETADMTRLAIERIATAMMPRVVAGIGAHGLLQPSRFERILRDLTMYLRQPVPDYCLATVGRASLRKTALRANGASHGLWLETTRDDSIPPAYFQRLYERTRDPWSFETSPYEAGKYRETLASLPRERYASALEVGCSIGVLTQQLARRCDSLLGFDVSESALEVARQRCLALPNVRFARIQIPREEPTGLFDLIVISEVAYYWQREDLDRAIAMLAAHQKPGAHLLLVHHTTPVPDYPLTGDEVHEAWLARPEWRLLKRSRHEGYRLDLLERC